MEDRRRLGSMALPRPAFCWEDDEKKPGQARIAKEALVGARAWPIVAAEGLRANYQVHSGFRIVTRRSQGPLNSAIRVDDPNEPILS